MMAIVVLMLASQRLVCLPELAIFDGRLLFGVCSWLLLL